MGSQGVGWGKTGVDAGSPGTKTQASSGPWQFLTSLSSAEESFPYFTATPEFMPALFRAVFLPRPRSVEPGLGWIAWACSPPAHFSLDSHFHPGQQRGQKGCRSSARKVPLESHQRAIASGGWAVGYSRSSCRARAGAGTLPRAHSGVPGDATLRAASPLLRYHADPHYPSGELYAPAPSRARAPSGRSLEKPGQRCADEQCLRFLGGKSWREPEPSSTSR